MVNNIATKINGLYNKKINYNALHHLLKKRGYEGVNLKRMSSRIDNFFKKFGINTYGDAVDKYSNCKIYSYEKNFRGIFSMDVGPKILSPIYLHFNSLGIKLFPNDYTPEELGNNCK